jgi:hypothetical protein
MRTLATVLLVSMAIGGCAGPLDDYQDAQQDPFPPRTFARDKPVIMVHGFAFFGESSDPLAWQPLKDSLSTAGWNQPLQSWGYYGCDVGFDLHANDHGSHSAHSTPASHISNECSPMAHTRETPIEHLAYHWAWTIYDLYASFGQCVDAVAHSMGGLIVRYALGQVQTGNPEFPPLFCVEDVVTLGTPHTGSELAEAFALFCPSTQCNQMLPGSPFLSSLAETAQSPGGFGGTDWTLIGSQSDFVVSVDSALGMSAAHLAMYFDESGISHALNPNYLADFGSALTAAIRFRDGNGEWRVSSQAQWPLAWIDQSLVYDETSWLEGTIPPTPVTTPVYPTTLQGGIAPGKQVEFQATCSDSNQDLEGAVWSTATVNGWQVLDQDTVQFHAHPWSTSQLISFPSAGTYKVRVECINTLLGSSQTEWTIIADASYNEIPTASRIQPSEASLQAYTGDTVSFQASCANADGDLDRAEWWTRPSGGAWSQTTVDTVQWNTDPWTTGRSYTMTSAGTVEVQVKCIDDAGSHSDATWTIQIIQRPTTTTSPPASGSGATRFQPASASVSIVKGQTVDFDVGCEDAAHDLDRAEWWVKAPSGGWSSDDVDTVQFHANPWHSYESYSFPSSGSYGVRATCVKETGASSSVEWTINVQ